VIKTEDDMHRPYLQAQHLQAQHLPVQRLSDRLSAQGNDLSIEAFANVKTGGVICLQACPEDNVTFVFHCKQMTS